MENLKVIYDNLSIGIPYFKPEPVNRQHITLKFLGDVDESQIEVIKNEMLELKNYLPVIINFDGFGVFYRNGKPGILYAKFKNDGKPGLIHSHIEKITRNAGIPDDSRAFEPHLTLWRIKTSLPENRLKPFLDFNPEVTTGIKLNNISLMKSELKPAGPVYTKLYTI
ncbi:MAG: RNA 2',3'-cyclic phosphodiesterase [Ignavibacteriaceae bacterium]|nr:RNA 2',3'-cyclic phosphodiesterase [Ignavibacteriaceae bacterium]